MSGGFRIHNIEARKPHFVTPRNNVSPAAVGRKEIQSESYCVGDKIGLIASAFPGRAGMFDHGRIFGVSILRLPSSGKRVHNFNSRIYVNSPMLIFANHWVLE